MEGTKLVNDIELKTKKDPIKLLVFSASLRTDSLNTQLAKLAIRIIEKHGGIVDYAEMKEFDCPSYNGDVELKSGIANGANEFNKRLSNTFQEIAHKAKSKV